MSLPLPALIHQLRTIYPAASLTSELLATEFKSGSGSGLTGSEESLYVVRALIQIGSFTLATGLAAAADIEAAEDRAKCRAIETLLPSAAPASAVAASSQPADRPAPPTIPAVPPLPPIVQTAPAPIAAAEPQTPSKAAPDTLTDWDNPLRTPSANLDLDFDLNSLLQDSAPEPVAPEPPAPKPVLPEPAAEDLPPAADLFAAVNSDSSASLDPPVNLADLNLTKLTLPKTDVAAAETAEKPTRRKSTAALPDPAPIVPPAEIDRSGEIARIGVEMKRLGWDTKKGRDHLQKTYGKRSRQELNDDELMDFLRYLETQPSSAQMPF